MSIFLLQVKAGFILNVICVLVLIGFIETLGDHLYSFHQLPPVLLKQFNITQ